MESTSLINSKQASTSMYSLEDLQALVHKKVEGFCRKNSDESILQPVNYILQLGGKRVRPLLTLLAAEAFGDDIEDAVYPAIAMEIFHNFTLMHDDIMDNLPTHHQNTKGMLVASAGNIQHYRTGSMQRTTTRHGISKQK
jgi:hypothetical protein